MSPDKDDTTIGVRSMIRSEVPVGTKSGDNKAQRRLFDMCFKNSTKKWLVSIKPRDKRHMLIREI